MFSQPLVLRPLMAHDAFGLGLVVTTEPQTLFSWKYAAILVELQLVMVAVVFGLKHAGVDPSWFAYRG